jgi:hypothetical protein
MNGDSKREILALARSAHDLTEAAYRTMPATRGGAGWQDKQRVLLADMALHLLQTSLADGELAPEQLQRNLYAILNLSSNFLPQPELAAAAASLLPPPA